VKVWIVADVSREIPGGMLRHMESHADGLRRLGHAAQVFCSEDFGAAWSGQIGRRLSGLHSIKGLVGKFRAESPDLVNVHTLIAPAWIAAQQLGLLGKAKIVVMSYGADERVAPRRSGLRHVVQLVDLTVPARFTLPRATGIWCVNNEDRAFVLQRYGLSDRRVALIPHACDELFYEPPRGEASRAARQLLFVGTWIPRKGTAILGAALPRLISRRPDLRITLAGTIVDEQTVRTSFPEAAQAALTVRPRVSPLELRELYRTSTMLLVPSEVEGLPIVLLEAMASSCPSLSAANSGMADVIVEGENGWLLSTREPDRWAARVESLLDDEPALRRAGEGARLTAARFRIDRVTAEAVAWYEFLLGAHRERRTTGRYS